MHGPRAGLASGQGKAKRARIPRLRGASGADPRGCSAPEELARGGCRRETIVKNELCPRRQPQGGLAIEDSEIEITFDLKLNPKYCIAVYIQYYLDPILVEIRLLLLTIDIEKHKIIPDHT